MLIQWFTNFGCIQSGIFPNQNIRISFDCRHMRKLILNFSHFFIILISIYIYMRVFNKINLSFEIIKILIFLQNNNLWIRSISQIFILYIQFLNIVFEQFLSTFKKSKNSFGECIFIWLLKKPYVSEFCDSQWILQHTW